MIASRRALMVVMLGWALWTPACGCLSSAVKRPYPAPQADDVISTLKERNQAVRSFRAESTMDYRVGGERVKGTVLIAGKRGARVRFNAENPTGGSVAVDLACDGIQFQYVSYNDNCQLTGPCTADAIARLLGVRLEPDEFMLLAIGGVPIIDHQDASVKWLEDEGRERITLEAADGRRQIIELAGAKDKRWDVVAARVLTPRGEVEWKVRNKGFESLGGNGGIRFRVPERTLFEQPMSEADLLVEWKDRELNIELPDGMFGISIPAGLPRCGPKK